MAKRKEKRCYRVRTKDERTYKIIADYMQYSNKDETVFFKKQLKGQINSETNNDIWIVALFKYEDIEFVGIDGFIYKESLPFDSKTE